MGRICKARGRDESVSEGVGVHSCHAWPWSYDHRPSHPHNAETKHVAFSPTRQGGGGGDDDDDDEGKVGVFFVFFFSSTFW